MRAGETGLGPLRLGVNIDHVATIRNARGGRHPDPLRAAELAIAAGADGITVHLREDRRHIRDTDVRALKAAITRPINFEMAATVEMVAFAQSVLPHAACIVPERRNEVTTEGGLNAAGQRNSLASVVNDLTAAGIRVSLFIDADRLQADAAAAHGAPVVELHTGRYCEAVEDGDTATAARELARITDAAHHAHGMGLEVHAGHGLSYKSVGPIAAISPVRELNIGHFLIGEAVFLGLGPAIAEMRRLMDAARATALADAALAPREPA